MQNLSVFEESKNPILFFDSILLWLSRKLSDVISWKRRREFFSHQALDRKSDCSNIFLSRMSALRSKIKEVVDPYMGKFFEVLNDPVSVSSVSLKRFRSTFYPKQFFLQSLRYENECALHWNEHVGGTHSTHSEWFRTKTRLNTEAISLPLFVPTRRADIWKRIIVSLQ